jgi:flagellar hook protein FlgE
MTLQGSFATGVSGLVAYSDAMSTITQNISNLRTVGYRRQEAEFSTLIGAKAFPNETSGGVKFSTKSLVNVQGQIEVTGRQFDLALSGDGMFVYGSDAKQGGGTLSYSRAGQLDGVPFPEGSTTAYFGNTQGLFLMGWPTDDAGVPTSTDAGALVPIIAAQATPPNDVGKPTTTGTLNLVLPAQQPTTTLSTDIAYFDQNGDQQTFNLVFTRTAANTWQATGTPPGGTPINETLTFDGNGNLTSPPTISAGGLFDLDIAGVSQRGTEFIKIGYQNDGLGKGQFVRYEVDQTGLVSGLFSSGAVRSLYRVAIADFANPNALEEHNASIYSATDASGAATLRVATIERTTINPGAVEISNMDLADGFTKMIVTQRAYDSSAQVVRTIDEMTQTIRDLKR